MQNERRLASTQPDQTRRCSTEPDSARPSRALTTSPPRATQHGSRAGPQLGSAESSCAEHHLVRPDWVETNLRAPSPFQPILPLIPFFFELELVSTRPGSNEAMFACSLARVARSLARSHRLRPTRVESSRAFHQSTLPF